jgi:hypothetical protein
MSFLFRIVRTASIFRPKWPIWEKNGIDTGPGWMGAAGFGLRVWSLAILVSVLPMSEFTFKFEHLMGGISVAPSDDRIHQVLTVLEVKEG